MGGKKMTVFNAVYIVFNLLLDRSYEISEFVIRC
jgi:hypothetical protein